MLQISSSKEIFSKKNSLQHEVKSVPLVSGVTGLQLPPKVRVKVGDQKGLTEEEVYCPGYLSNHQAEVLLLDSCTLLQEAGQLVRSGHSTGCWQKPWYTGKPEDLLRHSSI